MNLLLKLEQTAIFAFALFSYAQAGYSGVAFLLLFFIPDIGMIGYLVNNKIGAITYNSLHHQGIILTFIIIGIASETDVITQISLIFLAHSAFDRVFGYGLKTYKGFKDTHLGIIGGK